MSNVIELRTAVDSVEACRDVSRAALEWLADAYASIESGQCQLQGRRSALNEDDQSQLIKAFDDAAMQARSAANICDRISEMLREAN
jgi:hypothetical protein